MANTDINDYWNDILMAWDQLEFRLLKTPPEALTAREYVFLDNWKKTAGTAAAQIRAFRRVDPPECFMCRSAFRASEARMLSGGQLVHVTCAAETAGVEVRYGR